MNNDGIVSHAPERIVQWRATDGPWIRLSLLHYSGGRWESKEIGLTLDEVATLAKQVADGAAGGAETAHDKGGA